MDKNQDIKRRLLETFQIELDEHLATLNKGLILLEQGISEQEQEKETIAELFRASHSIKGASMTVGIEDINMIAHRMEDVFSLIRRKEIPMVQELSDLLFKAIDILKSIMLEHLKGNKLPFEQFNGLLKGLDTLPEKIKKQIKSQIKQNNVDHKTDNENKPDKNEIYKPDRELDDKKNHNEKKYHDNEPDMQKKGSQQLADNQIIVEKETDISAINNESKNSYKKEDLQNDNEDNIENKKSYQKTKQYNNENKDINNDNKDRNKDITSKEKYEKHIVSGKIDETIRVKSDKLDSLMANMGELMVSRMRTAQRLTELKKIQLIFNKWQKDWRKIRGLYKQTKRKNDLNIEYLSLLDFMDKNENYLKSQFSDINKLIRKFTTDYDQLSFLADDLQDKVRQVRMRPISSIFDTFPRMIRDLARQRNKRIIVRIEGGETELDRKILDNIKDPLTHILRNAVDHGIETIDERKAAGKNEAGTIKLNAQQKGSLILIEIADDGIGIDLEKVKLAAIQKGHINEQRALSLDKRELMELIFRSGLSTKNQVSDISGRGVGLDVVRDNLERLHGQISVDTTIGKGTAFTLTVSLSLATSKVLILKVADEIFAIPCSTVERIIKINPSEIGIIEGKTAIKVNNNPIPMVSLDNILELSNIQNETNPDKKISVVVLCLAEKRIAFKVDDLLETQELVIKNLGNQLKRVRNVAGASILGNGNVVIILNVADLMKSSQKGIIKDIITEVKVEEQKQYKLLVADDSITTRTLEKNILENAGYSVITAADGQQAWDLIQSEHVDGIVSDVNMPGLDGFAFGAKVKNDERFKSLPFILVTSLESKEDKLRGMEVGADAYIVKGTFDQKELLETIEHLIG